MMARNLIYLKLARAVIEDREREMEREKVMRELMELENAPSPTLLQLNGKQCTRLWGNLRAAYDHFLWAITNPQSTGSIFPNVFEEFYVLVTRANEIKQHFGSPCPWLQASIFQGHQRQAFMELTRDLQSCVEAFHETSCDKLVSFSDSISRQYMEIDGDYETDMRNFRTELLELNAQFLTGEVENLLVKYLIEREKSLSGHDSHVADQLPPYYIDTCGYPTSILSHIDHSASASVYMVNWLGLICAKKHFKATKDENLMKEFMKEVKVLATSDHPNIVKLLCTSGTSDETSEVSFVMELMPMNLSKFVEERWRNPRQVVPFSVLAAVDIMLQIARAMVVLHDHDIVHRDLKSSNILVAPSAHEKLGCEGYTDHLKVSDFGIAKMMVHGMMNPSREKIGTTKWMAPEAFAADEAIDWKKADVYSFAMTCSEILTGTTPFSSVRFCELPACILRGERPKLPADCPNDLASLLEGCWKTEPYDRPSFTKIKGELRTIKRRLLRINRIQRPSLSLAPFANTTPLPLVNKNRVPVWNKSTSPEYTLRSVIAPVPVLRFVVELLTGFCVGIRRVFSCCLS